jgi:hypothetical protein
MALEERWSGKAEAGIMRAQDNSMPLEEKAAGYKTQVEDALSGTMAKAVRNEIRPFTKAVLESQGPARDEALQKLLARLKPFRSIFKDVSDDESERAAFIFALVKHEKSLQ